MTKKDYIKAAKIVFDRESNGRNSTAVLSAFIEFFQDDNPNFDKERFVAACNGQKFAKKSRSK